MPGLSHTLDIARRAMTAQQGVLSIIGHNVANTNTPGYTRQVARLVQEVPGAWDQQVFGNGVSLDGIDRKRDRVIDQELRQDFGELGRWESRAKRLETMEGIINEPSDSSISAAMDEFWNAWSELSGDPDDQTRRVVVREQGRVLVYRFQTMRDRMMQLGQDINNELDVRVDEFNLILGDLRNLNTLIKESELQGNPANDLRDRRDLLLDQLSKLASVSYGERDDGVLYVRLDHSLILDEGTFRPLQVQLEEDPWGGSRLQVALATGAIPEIASGEMGGLIEFRGQILPDFMSDLDQLASGIITEVNRLHQAGPSGSDFFGGSGLMDIDVAPEIEDNLNYINPSTSGLPGDNDIALAISQLRDARVMLSGSASFREYWNGMVGTVGVTSREASFQQESLELTTESLIERRNSAGGVSLDEELTNMLAAQQAYIAAVKVFQAAEDMMDVLMSV